jgi:uncharacterized protein YceK
MSLCLSSCCVVGCSSIILLQEPSKGESGSGEQCIQTSEENEESGWWEEAWYQPLKSLRKERQR